MNVGVWSVVVKPTPEAEEKEVPIVSREPYTLGRGKQAHILVKDRSVSRVHGTFQLDDSHNLMFTDTGSSFGSYINEERIHAPTLLKKNDVLLLGSAIPVRICLNPMKIVTSRVSARDCKKLESSLTAIGAELLPEWSPETSFLVMNTREGTSKLLLASLDRVPVVTPQFFVSMSSSKPGSRMPRPQDFAPPRPASSSRSDNNVSVVAKGDVCSGTTLFFLDRFAMNSLQLVIERTGGTVCLLDVSKVHDGEIDPGRFVAAQIEGHSNFALVCSDGILSDLECCLEGFGVPCIQERDVVAYIINPLGSPMKLHCGVFHLEPLDSSPPSSPISKPTVCIPETPNPSYSPGPAPRVNNNADTHRGMTTSKSVSLDDDIVVQQLLSKSTTTDLSQRANFKRFKKCTEKPVARPVIKLVIDGIASQLDTENDVFLSMKKKMQTENVVQESMGKMFEKAKKSKESSTKAIRNNVAKARKRRR